MRVNGKIFSIYKHKYVRENFFLNAMHSIKYYTSSIDRTHTQGHFCEGLSKIESIANA